jgi:hypothetical protein
VVYELTIEPDGKILAAGYFTAMNGQSNGHFTRLNIDGTLDTNFHANVNGVVRRMAIQPDGKIIIGGAFTRVNGTPRQSLARLYPWTRRSTPLQMGRSTAFSCRQTGRSWCRAISPN